MKKVKIVNSGKIDKYGVKKIGKSLLITIGAAVIGWIANLTGLIDFGSANDFMVVLLPWIANTLKIWLGKYESK